jgi:quercetin dioxygenase-like cupin family protein
MTLQDERGRHGVGGRSLGGDDIGDHGHDPVVRLGDEIEVADLGPNRAAFAIAPVETGGTFSLTDFTMAPPPAPGPPPHAHEDADECVYVLEGTLRMGVGDMERTGGPGSVMLAPRGMLHSLVNVGPGPARFVVVLCPGGFEGFWREMAALRARGGGPPDPDAVLELQDRFHMTTGRVARRLE